jgi:ABC-type transport system involved in multi-copper enzyme maturation permease subunit
MLVGWGYAMYAFVLAAIIRSQIGAIVAFLLIPLIGENILANIFHSLPKYLPFMSLQNIVSLEKVPAAAAASLGHNVTVTVAYIVVGLAVASVLFVRRDAN